MKLLYWLRLIRWKNLLIIALTMYVVHGIEYYVSALQMIPSKYDVPEWKFGLIVMVMVLLAAAGNIINDYFDIRVDRINKPNRVVIGKYIKRRVAMISHQVLNATAVLVGFYLAYDIGNLWLGLIPVFIASLLWFYSVNLKKRTVVGNLAVALLIAIVPFWAGIFQWELLEMFYTERLLKMNQSLLDFPFMVLAFSVFGFLLTWIREMQKDIEDIIGDEKVGFKTLPIKHGVRFTKVVISVIYIGIFVGLIFLMTSYRDFFNTICVYFRINILVMLIGMLILPLIISWVFTLFAKKKSSHKMSGTITKIAMIGGLFFLNIFFQNVITGNDFDNNPNHYEESTDWEYDENKCR